MIHPVMNKWDQVQDFLQYQSDISKTSYQTFLKDLRPLQVSHDDKKIIIKAESTMLIDFIKKKFLKHLLIAIDSTLGKSYDIAFIVDESELQIEEKNQIPPLPSADNSEDSYHLNRRYTFDTFVVGNNNKFAHAAALAVAKAPADSYNPLFIYGGVGLGKTHLMHSIAHYVLQQSSQTKVLYVSSEKFTNELIHSIQTDKNEAFRQKYRNIDVLLVDDIQFIAEKERTQEEFFHTFNTLHEAKKQIIISSDRPPKEIVTLEERLRSRFEWGLIADIQAPDFETRMAILKNKATFDIIDIDDDALEYVASNVKSNIRELEGAVNKIVAYSRLIHNEKSRITLALAEEALKDLISPTDDDVITPERVLQIVSEHFNVNPNDIIGKKRPQEIAFPRQIVMYLSRKLTDTSLPKIGEFLGKRDHSTVLHGYNKIKKEMQNDRSLKGTIDLLIKKITAN